MPRRRSKNQRKLHPSIRSARLLRHLEAVRSRLRDADVPPWFDRRDAERGHPDGSDDWALLDLLTAAIDLAEDRQVQTLAAYARTSLILDITRSGSR